jgi:hypothetical protein
MLESTSVCFCQFTRCYLVAMNASSEEVQPENRLTVEPVKRIIKKK